MDAGLTPELDCCFTPSIAAIESNVYSQKLSDWLSGAIFLCYNDYRTHVGDRGVGPLRQRVHGLVDIYGVHKPSFELLRRESSPIESITVERQANKFRVMIRTRGDLPAYTFRGYKLRGLFFGQSNIPIERQEFALPEAALGKAVMVELLFTTPRF